MPWRGPQVKGEFPTLGYVVGEWIEEALIVPDGTRRGQPYLLTDEMWRHILRFYRLHPDATEDMGSEAFVYYGSQLVRPQKWGKDPFAAAECCLQGLGPALFAGWDANGEPVGRPVDTPWIQCVGTAEDQTDNTFRPIVTMLSLGPLADTPGLDVGDTRIKLPDGDGWIEPATSSGRARLGARLTFASFTESGLLLESSGGTVLAKNMKRNLAGMGGRWKEITNAWDPSERSVAQRTYKAKAPGVYLDYRQPRAHIDLDDDAALREEIRYVYGDSIAARGGWVRENRIIADIRDSSTGEAEARRFFLNEITVGTRDAVDSTKWATLARAGELLDPGCRIALGFDGSRNKDATSLVASRLSDGRLFPIRTWEHDGSKNWRVPRVEVDQVVRDTFEAYSVTFLYADPYRWQDYLDAWEAAFPGKVVEFPTAVERRMDRAIERVLTAVRGGELTHNGDEVLARHVANTALAKGSRKASHEADEADDDGDLSTHYLKVVKKKQGHWIDAFVAAILAYAARGKAIEEGLDVDEEEPVEPWAIFA